MKKTLLASALVLLIAAGCNRQNYTNTPPPEANNQTPTVTSVKVALIAIGDAGKLGPKIGCDDSVVYVTHNVPTTTQPLNVAMKELFNLNTGTVKDPAYPMDLYNVIYKMEVAPSNLKFDHATIDNSVAKLYLTGKMEGLGGVCDSPRVPAQIEYTAKQFSTVSSVETYLNNIKIDWTTFGSMK